MWVGSASPEELQGRTPECGMKFVTLVFRVIRKFHCGQGMQYVDIIHFFMPTHFNFHQSPLTFGSYNAIMIIKSNKS